MYLVMNRFHVRPGAEAAFEEVWLTREVHLHTVPGFAGFQMLRGGKVEEGGTHAYTLYASHTAWENEAAFLGWTRSQAFRDAHRGAGKHGDLYVGGPKLETFETLQTVHPDGSTEVYRQARTQAS
ncbi:MAG: antibiotic biosynthesis monooxygenase [Pseudomonadota bacterium]